LAVTLGRFLDARIPGLRGAAGWLGGFLLGRLRLVIVVRLGGLRLPGRLGSRFLAGRGLGAVGQDLVDAYQRERLAMAALAAVVMAPALLEDDDLVGQHLL